MRGGRHGAARALACLLSAAAGAGPAGAACAGRDLFPSLQATAPAAWAEIEAGRRVPHAQGILFRISRDGVPPSHLFGTLHLSDPRVVGFPAAALAALDGARRLAVEIDEAPRSLKARRALAEAPTLAAEPGRSAADLLDAEEAAGLRALIEARGLPPSAASLRPAVLALVLDLPPCAKTSGGRTAGEGRAAHAERVLARRARARGIAVVGLETLEEQIGSFADLPAPAERDLLRAVLRQAPLAEDAVETTIARYVARDAGGLLAWMRASEPLPGEPGARLPAAFLDRLIDRRNRRLRERARPLLDQGGAFIAVGTAHLPGEAGLVSLLAQDGYAVVRVE